jgi:hypothetical protein
MAVSTVRFEYDIGGPLLYIDNGKPYEFGPYYFQTRAWRRYWQNNLAQSIEELNKEFGLKSDFIKPVFLPDEVDVAPPVPPVDDVISELRAQWNTRFWIQPEASDCAEQTG